MARAASEKQLPIGVTDRSPKAKPTAMAELTQEQHLRLFRLQKETLGKWDLRQLKQDAPKDRSQVPPHPAARCPKLSEADRKLGWVQLKHKRVYIGTGGLSAAIAASTGAIRDLMDFGLSRAEAEDFVFANYGTVAYETLAMHKERCAKGGRATGVHARAPRRSPRRHLASTARARGPRAPHAPVFDATRDGDRPSQMGRYRQRASNDRKVFAEAAGPAS